jgi:hypothetical protein
MPLEMRDCAERLAAGRALFRFGVVTHVMTVRVSLSVSEKERGGLTLVCIAWRMFCCRKALGIEIARMWQ